MTYPLDNVVQTIRDAERIFAATHIHPDGDALGSLLAFGDIARAMGKDVYLYCEDGVSHLYDFLPGREYIRTEVPSAADFDCGVALDCGDCFRLGREMKSLLAIKPFVVIDHHAGHKEFGDLRWIEPGRSATGEMVFELANALDVGLSRDAAYCLYTAIVSDTGSFRYSSTTQETFRICRELLGSGIRPEEVAGNLFDNYSPARLKLLREVLGTLELYDNERIAIVSVSRDQLNRTGATEADTETFINYARAIKSVLVAVFIKEKDDGVIGVSLRSKGESCDVAQLAARFGGGGHRNAAGCKLRNTTVEETRRKLLHELLPLIQGAC